MTVCLIYKPLFKCRESLIGNLDEKRAQMASENSENRIALEQKILEANAARTLKNK